MNDNNANESLPHNQQSDILSLILQQHKYCLFLDIDGTLCDFQLDPEDCFIPVRTLNVLRKIMACSVPVIAVTGRDIEAARKLFDSVDLPIAALHGLEIYLEQDTPFSLNKNEEKIKEIHYLLFKACVFYPDLLIENKGSSIALHYRKCPDFESIARQIMLEIHQHFPELKLIQGKFVFELISAQANKGLAIQHILQHLNHSEHYSPIFIGDDLTDEDGFVYVNQVQQGISIKVGQGETEAKYRFEDIDQVYQFLALFLEHIQRDDNNMISNNNVSGEKICLN